MNAQRFSIADRGRGSESQWALSGEDATGSLAGRSRFLSGWGNYPVQRCLEVRPERAGEVQSLLARADAPHLIARGLGRSYGDAALNADGGVLSLSRLDRLLAFDPESGEVECEAGVSVADLVRTFLPRGFFPPVTPGTKHVTVGGAIAADVHGKNHHRDGSLAGFVVSLRLALPNGEVLCCSPEENAELFWATVGGMGLTGVILSARLRLRPVESAYLRASVQRAGNLHEALALFQDEDSRYTYSVAWVDGLARGRALGRSVLIRGNHAAAGDLPSPPPKPALLRRLPLRVPVSAPPGLLNRYSVRLFNALYYRVQRDGPALVHYDPFFYPLDAVEHWNRIYGRRGFLQYQAVVPLAEGERALAQLLEAIGRAGRASFLGVLKRFGRPSGGWLSFPFEGYTLSLDLPGASSGTLALLRELDRIVLAHGGRIYLAKDARLDAAVFRDMYPAHSRFQEMRARIDPRGRLSSCLARRLGLAVDR